MFSSFYRCFSISLCLYNGCHVTQIILIRVILQPCVYFTALSFCHPQNIFKESCQRNKIRYLKYMVSIICWFLCQCGLLLCRAVIAQYMCLVTLLCYCYMLLDYTFTSVTFYVHCVSNVDSNCVFVVSLLR